MPKIVILGGSKTFKIFLLITGLLCLPFLAGIILLATRGPCDALQDEIKKVQENDPDRADGLYQQLIAQVKADKNAPPWALCNTNYDYAVFLKEHGKPFEALGLLTKNLDLSAKKAPPDQIANLIFQIAEIRLETKKKQPIKQADLDQLLSVEKIWPRTNNPDSQGWWSGFDLDLGKMYGSLGQYAQAMEAFNRSIKESGKLEYMRAEAEEGIIDLLVSRGNFEEANKKYIEYIPTLTEYAYIVRSGFRKSLRRQCPGDNSFDDQEIQLLKAKDFGALDALADKLSQNKKIYSNGRWAINDFYESLETIDSSAFDSIWRERIDLLEQWIKSRPDSATARVALGRALTSYAWKARGGGWSDSVSENGWKLFGERLSQARAVFEQVKNKPPEWYTSMQRVALGQGWEKAEYDKMVNECRKKYSDYDMVVFVKGWWLQPRWHGAEGDYESYLLSESKAVERVRKNKAGDVLYARGVWYLDDNFIDNFLNESKMEWPKIKSGLLTLIKQYPDAPVVRGMLSTLAMEKGDKKTAEAAFTGQAKNSR